MDVPTLNLQKQYESMRKEIDRALQEVLDNSSFVLGDQVRSFERSFAEYCGSEHCVGVNSGTAALTLIYRALGLGEGDEVITTPFTFIATVEPILQVGATPVFADIDDSTYTLDPHRVEQQITPQTRAIVAVHLYGHPAECKPLRELADEHDLHPIEDAAQAHGARYRDRRVGSLGDAAAFSFYPGKNLGAYGDAGGVTTDDEALAETVRKLRDHGREDKYSHSVLGYNERMDGFQGAVLDVKLNHLDEENRGRRSNAEYYNQHLRDAPVKTPDVADHVQHVFHQYVVRVPRRDEVFEALREADIGAGVHYPVPLHLQPSLRPLGYEEGDFPVAETAAGEVLSLPIFADLSRSQLDYVCDRLTGVLEESSPVRA